MSGPLQAFAAADVAAWQGLPAGLALADAGRELPLSHVTGRGELGEERRRAEWVAVSSTVHRSGLRVWHEDGVVVLLEGRGPFDAEGRPLAAPEAGEPDAVLDTVLGRLRLRGGELVYARRGLALRVNPDNGVLLGLLGFAPTTAEDYRARLRPELPPTRLLPDPTAHGSAA